MYGPGRTSVKSCLFYKKICQQVVFSRATDLSGIVKNERNVPNVQRCQALDLAKMSQRIKKVTHDANSK